MKTLLAITLLLCGCATARPEPAIAVSGRSLVALGHEFEATAGAFYSLCTSRTLSAHTCDGWVDFAEKFKAGYAVAVAGWNLASADGGLTDPAAWTELVSELAQFTTIALMVAHPLSGTDGGSP